MLPLFSYNDTYIIITFDKSDSGASYLNKAVSLKITHASDNLGGTVTFSDVISLTLTKLIAVQNLL